MKPTLEQLNMLSEYELNCAAAARLGYTVDHSHRNYTPQCNDVMWYQGKTYYSADYCNTPNDYMTIAIEYGITINFEDGWVIAVDEFDIYKSNWIPKSQTGRAVITAFLMMENNHD